MVILPMTLHIFPCNTPYRKTFQTIYHLILLEAEILAKAGCRVQSGHTDPCWGVLVHTDETVNGEL